AELAPDMGDVRLQERAVRLAVHAPDEINEPSRRNDTIFIRGQAVEQAELQPGQADGTAFQQHAERVRVDGEGPDDKAGRYDVHGVARGTSLDGPQTHHEVLDAERLHEVVIRANLESPDDLALFALGTEEHDGG